MDLPTSSSCTYTYMHIHTCSIYTVPWLYVGEREREATSILFGQIFSSSSTSIECSKYAAGKNSSSGNKDSIVVVCCCPHSRSSLVPPYLQPKANLTPIFGNLMMCPCCTPDKDGQKSIPTKDIRANERPLHVIYAPKPQLEGMELKRGKKKKKISLKVSIQSERERVNLKRIIKPSWRRNSMMTTMIKIEFWKE